MRQSDVVLRERWFKKPRFFGQNCGALFWSGKGLQAFPLHPTVATEIAQILQLQLSSCEPEFFVAAHRIASRSPFLPCSPGTKIVDSSVTNFTFCSVAAGKAKGFRQ